MGFKDALKKKGAKPGFPPSGDKEVPEDEKGAPAFPEKGEPGEKKGGFKEAAKNAKKKKPFKK